MRNSLVPRSRNSAAPLEAALTRGLCLAQSRAFDGAAGLIIRR